LADLKARTVLTTLRKIRNFVIEIGKWGIVLWLLFPLHRALNERVDFTRVVLGILLFVLFAGKLFYDTIIDSWRNNPERKPAKDLLSMVAIVTVISLVVGIVIIFVGLLVFEYLKTSTEPNQE